MTAPADRPVTAGALAEALRARLDPAEWHVEAEVTLAGRRLDMVAFNLWGARGYRVVGYELKVTRGDWLRELGDFRKAEEWQRVVDDFYLVAPAKLVRQDELPEGWGLLELCGSRLITRRYPAKHPLGHTLPREVVARFFGRLARRDRDEAYRLRDELRREVAAQVRSEGEHTLARVTEELHTLRRHHAELLGAMGIPAGTWMPQERALRVARVYADYTSHRETFRHRLTRLAEELGEHHAALQRAVATLAEAELP